MKKKSIVCLIAVLCLLLAACSDGKTGTAELSHGQSSIYTEEEIMDAMDVVLKYFSRNFEGCTLTKLWYDEEYSEKYANDWAQNYEAEEAIVLLSDFDVDSSGGDGSFEPDSTYVKWNWILVRSSGQWELKTWGYA